MAIIEELSCEWDPGKCEDRYRKRLKSVVERRRKGKTIKAPEAAERPAPAPDLMAALERTLAEIRGETGSAKPGSGNGDGRASKRQRQESK